MDHDPVKWDNGFLDNLFKYEWELSTSPAGAQAVDSQDPAAQGTVPTRMIRRSATPPSC
jgi:catalase-peroxidase